MIEVNLLPGSRKNASGGGFSFSLPSFSNFGGGMDRWVLSAVFITVFSVAAVSYLWLTSVSAREEIDVALEEALRDSTRFADIIQRTDLLQARSDSVVQRVNVIQEIDEGRYVWPHVLDEVARAVPEYTWLDQILEVSAGGGEVQFKVAGKAGNNFALARFMTQLEDSPFFRQVEMLSSQQTVEGGRQVVYSFQLEATYSSPPPDFIQTVPLFGPNGAMPERVSSNTNPGS